jgi:hypothetical protein
LSIDKEKGISRIVKIKDSNDVVRWMEPVCANLQRLVEKEQAERN